MIIKLRVSVLCLLLAVLFSFSGKLYAQVDSVNCVSGSMIGASDSTDIGRIIIGLDTMGSVYSHLANPLAEASYVFSPDTIVLNVGATYHFQVATIMNTLHDGPAKLTAFIDLNNDGAFELPYEKFWTAYTVPFVSYIMDTMITVPGYVVTNTPLRMRFIVNNDTSYNAASDSACGTYVSGETMDFVLIFNNPTTAITKLNASNVTLTLFPNPATNTAGISLSDMNGIAEVNVKLFSANGQMVYSNHYNTNGTYFSTTMDVSTLAKGLYFVEVNADGHKQVAKLSIQ